MKNHEKNFSQKLTNCCGNIDIICPCSKEELGQLIGFLNNGNFQCEDEIDSLNVFENLNKILGFPANLDSEGKFTLDDLNFNFGNFPQLLNTNTDNINLVRNESLDDHQEQSAYDE